MKRVYLACVRSIDLLTSLPEWDGKNVIVQGGSQGGGEMIQSVSFEKTTFNELPFKFEAGTPDYIGTTASVSYTHLDC